MSWNIGNLPEAEDLRVGATFRDKGSTLELHQGKHGRHDLKVVLNGRPTSHRMFAILFMSLYLAEERYLHEGIGKGGPYFLSYCGSWGQRVRGQNGLPGMD